MGHRHLNRIYSLAQAYAPLTDRQDSFIDTINSRGYATQYDVDQFEDLLRTYDVVLRPNTAELVDESETEIYISAHRGQEIPLVRTYPFADLPSALQEAQQLEREGYKVNLSNNEGVFYTGKTNGII